MPDNELADRMFLARNHLERELRRSVTLDELGEMVAANLEGRDKAFAGSVVARWLKAQQEPDTRQQWAALAKTLRVDPGWLTYGTGRMEPEPPLAPEDLPPIGHRPGDPAPRPSVPRRVAEVPAPKKGAKRQ